MPLTSLSGSTRAALLALTLGGTAATPGFALDGAANAAADQARYDACLARASLEPEQAFEDAAAWAFEGGGVPARHCSAMALLSLGRPDDAAARLEVTAMAPDAGAPEQRAVMLGQAGNAWLLAYRPELAERAFSRGLDAVPNDPDLLIDRARALAAQERHPEAISDLDAALLARSTDPLALRLRAEALLTLGSLAAAAADVRLALSVAPDDIETLVVRGKVREAQRLAGAALMD